MKRIIWGIAVSVLATSAADAALLSRVGGQAYYDTALDITWLADANYAQTSGYDSDGRMTWDEAQTWIGTLNTANHLGVNNWRLSLTLQPDASCRSQFSGVSYGYDCTGSEMGHLYNVDGISSSTPSPFSNVQPSNYWSGPSYAPDPGYAWVLPFDNGFQNADSKGNSNHAWAVHPGDIGAVVPVPAAGWLMASALGALGVLRRRCGSRS